MWTVAESWLQHDKDQRSAAAVADALGLSAADVETALAYWADYREEIDELIERHRASQDEALAACERRRALDAVALNAHRPELRGVDDRRVLEAAVAESRVVVTEDVSTFSAAITTVPHHLGVVYCHHARFPRTRPGLNQLRKALAELVNSPSDGLGEHPIIWWLTNPD